MEAGQSYVFKWTPIDPAGNVRIDLYKGNAIVYTIASATPDDGSKGRTLRDTLASGNDYRIRITSLSDGSSDFSDYFEII